MYSYIYIDMNSIHLHIWTLSVCNGFCTEDDDDDWWSRDSQKLSTRFHKNAPRFSVVSTMLFGSRNHDATQFLPNCTSQRNTHVLHLVRSWLMLVFMMCSLMFIAQWHEGHGSSSGSLCSLLSLCCNRFTNTWNTSASTQSLAWW